MTALALYIHWPFCKSKCPYCDFNSHVRDQIDEAAWERALLAELAYWAGRTQGRTLTSIFFGGGTPSLMPPRLAGKLIEEAKKVWVCGDIEITLEANPTSVESQKLKDFYSAGINRLSMGIQALNDADLKALGRQHSATEALAALELAAKTFPRFSFDLIYARPHQSVAAWEAELRRALTYGATHLSVYQLTIEAGTQFATLHQRGDLTIPDEETGAALYETTQEILNAAGLPAYEISNHAKLSHECQHNLTYWRYGDYVGIGPGAHGRVTLDGIKNATRTHRAPEEWLTRVTKNGHGLTETTPLPMMEQLHEMLLMGLRLQEGIPRSRLNAYGFAPNLQKIAMLQKHNLITQTDETLQATDEGRLRLNALLAELVSA